jgi:4-carboxymuconolactone decarboxylase
MARWRRRMVAVALVIASSLLPLTVLAEEANPEKPSAATRMWGKYLPLVRQTFAQYDEELGADAEGMFDRLYGREDRLDLKTRELCTIAILAALGRSEELNAHLMAGLNVGLTPAQIREAFIFVSMAAGWPAALDALKYFKQWLQKNKLPALSPGTARKGYRTTDFHSLGRQLGKKLFGPRLWNKYLGGLRRADPALARLHVAEVGRCFSRTILDDRTRELVLLAAFTALHSDAEVQLHATGAVNSGATRAEVEEVLYHTGIYAGHGATTQAMAAYRKLTLAR